LVLSGAVHDRLFRFGSDGSIEALRLPQAREVYLGLGGETALASTGRGGSFELWSAEGGGFRLRSLPGAPYGLQPSSLLRLAINDGLLAWSTWRGPLQMWDLTGEEPALAREIEGSPLSCTPSPDARWLAVNGRSGLYAYSTSSDARRELLARALDSETLAFSPDAGALVAHAKNLHARVWFTAAELTDWTESTLGLPADTAPSVTFSPSGQWMTTWSLTGLRLWRLAAPEGGRAFEPVAHLPDASSGHSYFASGAWLVTTSASGPVVAWELDTVAGTARPTELGTDGTLARATIAPDGTVVTLDREGGIRLVRRSAESWNLPGVELARLDDRVDVLRFLDGGERLLCAGDRVRVFTTDLDALVERSRDHLEKQHAETITELARDW
ncbi:MAG: WD40 repeat domain-containing protein, partial [Planctomycetota bacterium]